MHQGFGKEGGLLRPTEHVPDKEGVIPPDTVLTTPPPPPPLRAGPHARMHTSGG